MVGDHNPSDNITLDLFTKLLVAELCSFQQIVHKLVFKDESLSIFFCIKEAIQTQKQLVQAQRSIITRTKGRTIQTATKYRSKNRGFRQG